MEVHSIGKEKGPLVALVLALIVLGLGSLYLTWRSIAHQRKIVEDHMIRGDIRITSSTSCSLTLNKKISVFFVI